MTNWRGAVSATAVIIISLALIGCAIVDQFSDRAVEYNVQAEHTQQQGLLLNIVRASLRRPMQFTSLQSITGTASASGSVNGGYTGTHQTPYISLFGLSPPSSSTLVSGLTTATGGGSASMSGGPTFTVPVLDTQEFYQGVLNPIRQEVIDYYIQLGFPQELLFDIFVLKVELTRTDDPNCEQFTFNNTVGNALQFGQFQALADYLLASGFTIERVTDRKTYGPPIPISYADKSANAADPAKLVEALSKASSAGLDVRMRDKEYHLQKKTTRYRTCFAPHGNDKPTWLRAREDESYCGYFRGSKSQSAEETQGPRCGAVHRQEAEDGSTEYHGIVLSDLMLERVSRLQKEAYDAGVSDKDFLPVRRFQGRHVTAKFYTRSVEGILYYLGEITRAHLNPDRGQPRVIRTKAPLRFGSYPMHDCDTAEEAVTANGYAVRLVGRHEFDDRSYACENLFVLESGLVPGAALSVRYDGQIYSVPGDPTRAGRTMQVLELAKQLLALNTSSKQLPQTTVISIVGGTTQ